MCYQGGALTTGQTLTRVHTPGRSCNCACYSRNSPKRNKVKELKVSAHRSQTILTSGACIAWTTQVHVRLMVLLATLMMQCSEVTEGCL